MRALRVSGRSEGVEQCPVGSAGIEEGADAVVGEVGEPERGPFDAFDEVVGGFDIDQDTTTREVFDTLNGAEQACIRGDLDDDVLQALLDTPVLSEDDDGTAPSILSCLTPDAAREFFLSVAKATVVAGAEREGLSARIGNDEEACMRDLLTGVDVAALASEPESDNLAEFPEEFDVSGLIGLSDLSLGLFSCVPDVLVASMGGLTPEQESCVRGLMADVAAGDYRSVLASDPELDAMLESDPELAGLGPLLGLTFDLLACAADEALEWEWTVSEPEAECECEITDGDCDITHCEGELTITTSPVTLAPDTGNGSDDTDTNAGSDDSGFDDHADGLDWATLLDIGEAAPGAIDHDGDVDFFVFWAEQGAFYQIDVAPGTMSDSILELHDPEWFEATYEDTDFDVSISSIHWRANYTGDHYVSVRGYYGGTGTYALTVNVE